MHITPGFSPRLAAFLLITHLSALGVLALVPATVLLQIAIVLIIAISLVHAWCTHIWRIGPDALVAAEWDALGCWWVQRPGGELQSASLHGSSYVQPWLVILNFGLDGGGRRYLILPPDALEPEPFRRLCVRLRLAGLQEGGQAVEEAPRRERPQP